MEEYETWHGLVVCPTLDGWESGNIQLAERETLLPTVSDLVTTVSGAIIFTLVQPLLRKFLFRPLANKLRIHRSDTDRFCECLYQGLYYSCAWSLCAYVSWNSEFFYKTHKCWGQPFPDHPITTGAYCLYMLQSSWYFYQMYVLLMNKPGNDFMEMLIHHIATVALINFSYLTGYWRIGVVVMYCFDFCDIALQFNKVLRLYDNANPVPEMLAYLVFPPLPISWLYFRIYIFAKKAMWSAFAESIGCVSYRFARFWGSFNLLLFILLCLNIYWLYLILLTAFKHIVHGEALDDERDVTASQRADSDKVRQLSEANLEENNQSPTSKKQK